MGSRILDTPRAVGKYFFLLLHFEPGRCGAWYLYWYSRSYLYYPIVQLATDKRAKYDATLRRVRAAPAEFASVMGERVETGYLPLPARPAAGDAARCGAVPQPAEPAAEMERSVEENIEEDLCIFAKAEKISYKLINYNAHTTIFSIPTADVLILVAVLYGGKSEIVPWYYTCNYNSHATHGIRHDKDPNPHNNRKPR